MTHMLGTRIEMRAVSLGAMVLLALAPAAARGQQREPARGWVGVAYTTGVGQSDRGGVMVFNDYPVIESIEQNSPAERAGLQTGDTILAMNSQDLRKSPLPAASMIQPGQKIVFRFKRNDAVREVTVTVAQRPSGTSERVSFTLFEQSAAAAAPAAPATAPRQPQPPLPREVRVRMAAPPLVAIPPLVFGFGPRSLAVAGAELTGLNADLRSLVGISTPGIFVVNVALGTPAKESGLRPGDVIVRADAFRVADPGELIRVIRDSNASSIRLQIIRKKKPQTITLRW